MNLWGDGTVYSDPSVQGLDQATLARLLGIQLQGNNPMEAGGGYTLDVGQEMRGTGDGTSEGPSFLRNILRRNASDPSMLDRFDPRTGAYIDTSTEDSGDGLLGALTKAMVLGGVGAGLTSVVGAAQAGSLGAGAAGGGAAGGAAGGAGGWTAAVPGEMAANLAGLPPVSAAGELAYLPTLEMAGAGAAGGAAGAGLAGGGGAPAYTTAAADSQAANSALRLGANSGSVPSSVDLVNAGGTMSTGFNWGDLLTGKNLGSLLGAAAGAYGSRDQEQTQSREPWGPAQPLLQDVIGQARTMFGERMRNPISPALQQAYGNQAGLLNFANQAAPAMFAGMNANASGANAYDRNNPRRGLIGSSVTMPQFAGLLNFGGGNG